MINESDLIAELRGGGTQVTAEEFASQVKGMTEEQAMESSETKVLTMFSEIAMSHGFTPTLAANLLAEAGRDFELDAEWTPEDAIRISDWLKEAKARKRRAGSELPYEPDIEGASKLPIPVTDGMTLPQDPVPEPIEPEIVPSKSTSTHPVTTKEIVVNFKDRDEADAFLQMFELGEPVSLGKPGNARIVMQVSSYSAQEAAWENFSVA